MNLPEELKISQQQKETIEEALKQERFADALTDIHQLLERTDDDESRRELELIASQIEQEQAQFIQMCRRQFEEAQDMTARRAIIEKLRVASRGGQELSDLDARVKEMQRSADQQEKVARLQGLIHSNEKDEVVKAVQEIIELVAHTREEDPLLPTLKRILKGLNERVDHLKKVDKINTADVLKEYLTAIDTLNDFIKNGVYQYQDNNGNKVLVVDRIPQLQHGYAGYLADKVRQYVESSRVTLAEGKPYAAQKECEEAHGLASQVLNDYRDEFKIPDLEADLRKLENDIVLAKNDYDRAKNIFESINESNPVRDNLSKCRDARRIWPKLPNLLEEERRFAKIIARMVEGDIKRDIDASQAVAGQHDLKDRFIQAMALLAQAEKRADEVETEDQPSLKPVLDTLVKAKQELVNSQKVWNEYLTRVRNLDDAIQQNDSTTASSYLEEFARLEQLNWAEVIPLHAKMLQKQKGLGLLQQLERSYSNQEYDLVLGAIPDAYTMEGESLAGKFRRLETAANLQKRRLALQKIDGRGDFKQTLGEIHKALQDINSLETLPPIDYLILPTALVKLRHEFTEREANLKTLSVDIAAVEEEIRQIRQIWQSDHTFADGAAALAILEDGLKQRDGMHKQVLMRQVQLERLDLNKAWKQKAWKEINRTGASIEKKYQLVSELQEALLIRPEGEAEIAQRVIYDYWKWKYQVAMDLKIHLKQDYSQAYSALKMLMQEVAGLATADDRRKLDEAYMQKVLQDTEMQEPTQAARDLQAVFQDNVHMRGRFELQEKVVNLWLAAGEINHAQDFVRIIEDSARLEMQRHVLYFTNYIEAHRLYQDTINPDYGTALQKLRLLLDEGLADEVGRKTELERLNSAWKTGAVIQLLGKVDGCRTQRPVEAVNLCIRILALNPKNSGAISRLEDLKEYLPTAITNIENEIDARCQETATSNRLQDFEDLVRDAGILAQDLMQLLRAFKVVQIEDEEIQKRIGSLKTAYMLWDKVKQYLDQAKVQTSNALTITWNLAPVVRELDKVKREIVASGVQIVRLGAVQEWLNGVQANILLLSSKIEEFKRAYEGDEFTKVENLEMEIQTCINSLLAQTNGMFVCNDERVKTFDRFGIPEVVKTFAQTNIGEQVMESTSDLTILKKMEIRGIQEHKKYTNLRKIDYAIWIASLEEIQRLVKVIIGEIKGARNAAAEGGDLLEAIQRLEQLRELKQATGAGHSAQVNRATIENLRQVSIPALPYSAKCLKMIKKRIKEILEDDMVHVPQLDGSRDTENWLSSWLERFSAASAETLNGECRELLEQWCEQRNQYVIQELETGNPLPDDEIEKMSLNARYEQLYGSRADYPIQVVRMGKYDPDKLAEKIHKKSVGLNRSQDVIADTAYNQRNRMIELAKRYNPAYEPPPVSVNSKNKRQSWWRQILGMLL